MRCRKRRERGFGGKFCESRWFGVTCTNMMCRRSLGTRVWSNDLSFRACAQHLPLLCFLYRFARKLLYVEYMGIH